MSRGDHIRVRRGVYSHHGIDRGDGTVIHYNGSPRRPNGTVTIMSHEAFSHGRPIQVVSSCPPKEVEEVVARAESRLGEASYDLVSNNCEHFATWCASGKPDSHQVRRVINAVAAGVAVVWVAATLLHRPKGPYRT